MRQRRFLAPLFIAACGLTMLAGCASHARDDDEQPEVTRRADDSTRDALFGRVAKLEGEWVLQLTPEEVKQYGEPGTTVFKVSSNGSIVREIMFPGAAHEMTNVYHMDGDELVMTHYCAEGNQPRMEAELENATGDTIAFEFDEVSNLTSPSQGYMGAVTLTFIDNNTFHQTWTHYKEGKATVGPTFRWRRK